jgi:cytoskeletal protein RodZ
MSREFLKKLSEELKETRLEKGFTLEQIYGRTRIDMKFLQAIETGHFDIMPEVYMKAFIKEYAAFIDLDADATLKKFELARQGKNYNEEEIKVEEEEKETAKPETESKVFDSSTENYTPNNYNSTEVKNNNLVFAILAIVIIIITAVYFFFIRSTSDEIIIETPYEEIIKDQESLYEVKEDMKQEEPAAIDENQFVLRVDASDTSWIKIVIDEEPGREYILNPKSTKNFEARSLIELTLGNSGGITLYLNEEKLNFSGAKGRVRNIKINENGILSQRNN